MAIKVDGQKYIMHNGFIYRRLKLPSKYVLNAKQKESRKLYMRRYRLGKRTGVPPAIAQATIPHIVETLI